MSDCWVFFPEKKFLFHRVSEQKAFSPESSPSGKTGLMIETTKEPSKEKHGLLYGLVFGQQGGNITKEIKEIGKKLSRK